MDELSPEWDYYGEEDPDYDNEDIQTDENTTLFELFERCLVPTVHSSFDQVLYLLCSCLCFRIFNQWIPIPKPSFHALSFIFGYAALYTIIGFQPTFLSVIFVGLNYRSLIVCRKSYLGQNSSNFIMFILLGYLVFREHGPIADESWKQVRGIQMIMVMKILSLCFESETVKGDELRVEFLQYLGYIFCPANIVFGPWIPFNMYCSLFDRQKWNFRWLPDLIAVTGLRAIICLSISSCLVYWSFVGNTSRWVLAASSALSFRFSHYFISYLSETTSILSGFTSVSKEENPQENTQVVAPLKIEFPRSLVEVVVFWNMPMHRWLRRYIFRPLRHSGSKAIFITFLVSSALHGLSVALTLVLLSLGIFTYVEHTLREKLASIFDACILSRACSSQCQHVYKSNHPMVFLVNLGFAAWAYFNLIYLGVMMGDSSSDSEDGEYDHSDSIIQQFYTNIYKWYNLSFLNHWIMLFVYMGNKVI